MLCYCFVPGGMHFQCEEVNHCILKAYVCDAKYDCYDKSDERNCNTTSLLCTDLYHLCFSGECIPRDHRCDYQADCKDGSDEIYCPTVYQSAVLMDSDYRNSLTIKVCMRLECTYLIMCC